MIHFDRARISVVSRPRLLGVHGVYSFTTITGRLGYWMEVGKSFWNSSLLETGAGAAERFHPSYIDHYD